MRHGVIAGASRPEAVPKWREAAVPPIRWTYGLTIRTGPGNYRREQPWMMISALAALNMAPNKTDANDADGLAHLAEVGFYREVRVKGFDSMLTRTLVAARTRLVRMTTELSNQIRGLMKTFGLIVPAGKGSMFRAFLPIKRDWLLLYCRCWKRGAACAYARPISHGSSLWMRAKAKPVKSSCRSLASV